MCLPHSNCLCKLEHMFDHHLAFLGAVLFVVYEFWIGEVFHAQLIQSQEGVDNVSPDDPRIRVVDLSPEIPNNYFIKGVFAITAQHLKFILKTWSPHERLKATMHNTIKICLYLVGSCGIFAGTPWDGWSEKLQKSRILKFWEVCESWTAFVNSQTDPEYTVEFSGTVKEL